MTSNRKNKLDKLEINKLEYVKVFFENIYDFMCKILKNVKDTIQKKVVGFFTLTIFTIFYSYFYNKEKTESIDGMQVPQLGKNYNFDLSV